MMKNPLLNDPQVTWDMYQPRYQALLDREVAPDEIEGFLLEWSDLEIELSHIGSVRYLNAHLDTQDEAAKASKASYYADIQPHKDRMDAALRKKLLSMDHSHLPEDAVRMVRRFQADDRLFSEENIPLLQKMTELEQEYSQLSSNLRLDFRGEKLPFPRIKPFLTDPDRATREEAWMALQKADLEQAPKLDDLFLRQLQVRRQLARNAGYLDFRAYMWDRYHRFDYTPEDCLQFHQTVKEEVVPFAQELLEQHRQGLGVDELRPWDFIWYAQTDPQNRPPLQPFQTTDELIEKTEQVFFKLHPRMGELFHFFRENQAMDLGARENKLSQAYCIRLAAHKMPFVFQSAVGTAADVLTTLHEFGHAFHGRISMLSQRFIWNWYSSKEFVEVPSMGMECLPLDHLSPFYTPEELQRVKTSAALRMVHGLPWMCFLDLFQHWLYSEAPEDVTIDTLDQKARELVLQFQPTPSWEGFETYRGKAWHYFHIFNLPFYYIEYAFSGLGALQLWKNNQRNPQKTIEQYFAALEAGNSRSVPELYELCGLSFRFDRETVRDVMQFVRKQLNETPQP